MKSLKKTLSLVLVLVMVLGMFGSSFAAFTDAKTIQYAEAVEVMTGIGAIAGYPEGDFRPAGTITRAEAAKMVAYTLLGKTVADNLRAQDSSFADVGADLAWAVPSIEYLKSIGVVNGTSATTFNPNGQVTALELAKMLLVGLGFGVNGEYVGAGWDLAVAVDASKPDSTAVQSAIFSGRKAGASELSAAATREEAALYCFNMINKALVAYTKDRNIYEERTYIENVVVPPVAPSNTPTINSVTRVLTFRHNLYGTKLGKLVDSDPVGRPITVWYFGRTTDVISSVAQTPVVSFTNALTYGQLYVAVSNAGYAYEDIDLYTNNNPEVITKATIDGAVATTPTAYLFTNGTLTEYYDTDFNGKVDRLVAVVTYLGQVLRFAKDNPATTNVDERTITVQSTHAPFSNVITSKVPGFNAAYDAAVAAYTADKPCYLLITPDMDLTDSTKTGVFSVALPTAKTITPTAWNATSVTAGGEAYGYSQYYTNANGTTDKIQQLSPVNVLLDTYGYIINASTIDTSTTALYLAKTQVQDPETWATTYKARLLHADGSIQDVPVSYIDYVSLPAGGTLVYSEPQTTGLYTLTEIDSAGDSLTPTIAATSVDTYANDTIILKSGTPKFDWSGNEIKTNTKTIFYVRTGTDAAPIYKAYVGYAAVPTQSGTDVSGVVVKVGDVAAFVYISNAIPATASSEYIFLPKTPTAADAGANSDGTFYNTKVFIDGELKDVKLANAYPEGVYTAQFEDAFGVVTLVSGRDVDTYNTTATFLNNGWLKLQKGSNPEINLALATNCKAYAFGADGSVDPILLSQLSPTAPTADYQISTSRALTYATNDDGLVIAIFVAK